MTEVHDNIFVGSEASCQLGNDSLAVVHACKSPCHQRAVGYTGSLPNTHAHYLVLKSENDLYLNIIDPPIPLFKPELFSAFMLFSSKHRDKGRRLLIHCNQGESRAPSLALLYLSKSLGVISDNSFAYARADFETLYPRYAPGKGIQSYLSTNWRDLGGV